MRIAIDWLQDFVTLPGNTQELANTLTMLGLEADDGLDTSQLGDIIIAQVKECTKHPNADKLSLCKVYDGKDTLQIVCGAFNVKTGQKIAFAPLFISWFGFGLMPKVIIVVLVCFFPIVLNAILAFNSLSNELTLFYKSTGANTLKTFFKIRLPAALPQCFVGFKYAAINATVGAVIAEFIGSDKGLGFYISIVTGNI